MGEEFFYRTDIKCCEIWLFGRVLTWLESCSGTAMWVELRPTLRMTAQEVKALVRRWHRRPSSACQVKLPQNQGISSGKNTNVRIRGHLKQVKQFDQVLKLGCLSGPRWCFLSLECVTLEPRWPVGCQASGDGTLPAIARFKAVSTVVAAQGRMRCEHKHLLNGRRFF